MHSLRIGVNKSASGKTELNPSHIRRSSIDNSKKITGKKNTGSQPCYFYALGIRDTQNYERKHTNDVDVPSTFVKKHMRRIHDQLDLTDPNKGNTNSNGTKFNPTPKRSDGNTPTANSGIDGTTSTSNTGSKAICFEFASNGTCSYDKVCRFSHAQESDMAERLE